MFSYEVLARFIGLHAVEFLVLLLAFILILIFLLWRLFEAHYKQLWRMASNLWRWIRSLPLARHLRQKYPVLWSFLGRRLSPGGYLGIHLTIGIVLAVLAVAFFSNIAGGVMVEKDLVEFDAALSVSLYENANPAEVTVFNTITQLAGRGATILVGVVIGIALVIYSRWLFLFGWMAAILGNSILNATLKAIFQRARPQFPNPFLVEANWSFPSGHAMGAVVLYGMLGYLFVTIINASINKFLLVSFIITLVLLIGFSRLYLGVHFFSDVVAGYVAGAGWLAIVISGIEVARRRKS